MVSLPDLPGGERLSKALAVSLDGSTIVGYSSSHRGTEACVWTDDGIEIKIKGLGSLQEDPFESRACAVSADGKVVVGQAKSKRGREAFRWSDGKMVALGDLDGGQFQSIARGVSADGNTVVGTATVVGAATRGAVNRSASGLNI